MSVSKIHTRITFLKKAFCFMILVTICVTFVIIYMKYLKDNTSLKKELFCQVITNKERVIFEKLVNAFIKTVPFNVTYFMYGGTLLGSYRHHGMIPWDDDLDLVARHSDKWTLLNSIRTLYPEYGISIKNRSIWKFYHNTSVPTRTGWGAWPFIDIFFFMENETFIWDSHGELPEYIFEKKDVFPVTRRPFMGFMLPAPRNTRKVLEKVFDINMCVSNSWSHRNQDSIDDDLVVSVPCDVLRDKFPFVRRQHLVGKTAERLEEPDNPTSNSICSSVLS